jgi:hypothetical protein
MGPGAVPAVVLAPTLLASPFAAEAQQAAKVHRIGVLTLSTASRGPDGDAFLQGLREHGYVEGRNLALEHESLAQPGGNVTGLSLAQLDLSDRRLQLLKEIAPDVSLVAVTWNPADPPNVEYRRETEAAARALGLRLHVVPAVFVDKILRGAKPADLPVEQAATFELVINLKTARSLGLAIPPSILAQAHEVVER